MWRSGIRLSDPLWKLEKRRLIGSNRFAPTAGAEMVVSLHLQTIRLLQGILQVNQVGCSCPTRSGRTAIVEFDELLTVDVGRLLSAMG